MELIRINNIKVITYFVMAWNFEKKTFIGASCTQPNNLTFTQAHKKPCPVGWGCRIH